MRKSNDTAYGRAVDKRKIRVTGSQLALIHVAKKELALEDEDYRSILELYGGVSSAKFLTLEGFERVMTHFERLGFTSNKPKAKTPYRAPERNASGIPYPAQLKMIGNLFDQLGWTEPDRQRGFCQRVIKKPWPQTRAEANKVFEGLKAMLARLKKRSILGGEKHMDNEDIRQELMKEVVFEDLPPICAQAVNILGLEMVIKLTCEIGGTSLYIPKFESVIAKARDRLIIKQFNGSNYRDLALRYNLTEVWVRQIVNQDLIKKNQTSLFDE